MRLRRRAALGSLAAALLVSGNGVRALAGEAAAAKPNADPWAALRRLVGEWAGRASGRAGTGMVTRRYAFVLGERFLQETNVSEYPPQPQNSKGERHEHWSFFSHDRDRDLIVLRQFHVEGFVNTYRMAPRDPARPDVLVFESESFENFDKSWKARETYEFPSADELIETFELAPPGKPFAVYSRSQLRRIVR